jgi:hypothetical protein
MPYRQVPFHRFLQFAGIAAVLPRQVMTQSPVRICFGGVRGNGQYLSQLSVILHAYEPPPQFFHAAPSDQFLIIFGESYSWQRRLGFHAGISKASFKLQQADKEILTIAIPLEKD